MAAGRAIPARTLMRRRAILARRRLRLLPGDKVPERVGFPEAAYEARLKFQASGMAASGRRSLA